MTCRVCPILKRFFSNSAPNLKDMKFSDFATDKTKIGIGFKLSDYKQAKLLDINIEDKNRDVHSFVLGASGVGKSKLIEAMIEDDIRAGRNVVLIDPKGGGDLYSRVVESAYAAGREEELMYCSPIFPELSIEINVLGNYYLIEELVNHVMAPVSHENEFFYGAALETATFILMSLELLIREEIIEERITMGEVAKYVSFNGFSALHEMVKSLPDTQERQRLIEMGAAKIGAGIEYFEKITSTMRVALTEMTTGATSKVIGNAKENEFINRIERGEGVILYVQTGSMIVKNTSSTIAKVITSMIQSTAGRHDASGKKFQRPLCYYGDEFSNIVYYGIEDIFNKGRSAGLFITAATQSISDLVAEIGHDRTRKLLDNTSTKIIMRQNDLNSAQHVAAFGGLKKKYSPLLSLSGGITNREVEDEVIRPEDVMRLKKREFFYFGFEGLYRGKSKHMMPPEIQVEMPSALSVG